MNKKTRNILCKIKSLISIAAYLVLSEMYFLIREIDEDEQVFRQIKTVR